MKTALLLSTLIAVSALLFVVAYLLVQFISDRTQQAKGDAAGAAEADRPETGRARQRPSRRYRRLGGRAPRASRKKTRP
jgi:hypothetical protein